MMYHIVLPPAPEPEISVRLWFAIGFIPTYPGDLFLAYARSFHDTQISPGQQTLQYRIVCDTDKMKRLVQEPAC